jgi:hypothetical protein
MIQMPPCTEIPKSVAEAALVLHQKNNRCLRIADLEGCSFNQSNEADLWLKEGHDIVFRDLQSRNICSAVATYRALGDMFSASQLFDAARTLWRNEIGHEDYASGRLLALSSDHFDCFAEAATLIGAKPNQVFEVLHLVEATIPHSEKINPHSVLKLVQAQHEPTKNDLAAGIFFNALENRLKTDAALAKDLLEITKNNSSSWCQNLYGCVLYANVINDSADYGFAHLVALADSGSQQDSHVVIWTIGRILREKKAGAMVSRAAAMLIEKCWAQDEETRKVSLRALANAATTEAPLLDALIELSRTEDQYTLTIIAGNIATEFGFYKNHAQFFEIIPSLVNLAPSSKAGIDNYDRVLSELYESQEHRDFVVSQLTNWIVKNGNAKIGEIRISALFDQTIFKIVNDRQLLERVITQWLSADEMQLGSACQGLVSHLWVAGFKTPRFSRAMIAHYSASDLKYLARRMLGYVHHEEALISLTFSLLDITDSASRTFDLVHALLVKEIGRDYPSSTLDAIKDRLEKHAEGNEHDLLNSATAQLTSYMDRVKELPRLNELRGPMLLRRMIALKKNRQMRASQAIADEKSIVRQLMTEVPLKAGTGTFSVSSEGVGVTQELQSYSVEVALPRRYSTDPIGYAIAGLHFRVIKREQE